jgi:hypothetical protein
MNRLSRCASATVLALVAGAAPAATAASAVTIPNPCTIVPTATITKDLGFSATTVPKHKATTQGAVRTCTFTYPHLKLIIELSPPQSSGSGPVKTTHPSGLGSRATLYQPLPGSSEHFASLVFLRHGREAFLNINKNQPAQGLVKIGRAIYAKL